ncbi:octopine/nopaline transport system permease protein [Azospirillum lipoferum]|uniref:ABC transporter permease n=1 Tax=Azospirillum TaxID=191 RepID=UPI001B3BA08C|nr:MULTISPECIES: ABC transporter permease [Azospirillum]MCP1610879.1 octopine/nopaline transport system permease protein [Azospirillum lipoferum]MDW5533974.1 ABC transporter permease [Azospirillum sp. NL1]
MIDTSFLASSLATLVKGIPLTVQLSMISVSVGAILAFGLALMRVSGNAALDLSARAYIFVYRGTPLLVQIYIIYYGLSQFPALRHSFAWPYLREAYWCAVIALALNTAAYSAEIIRGGILSVNAGQVEAARACGMSQALMFRRIVLPQALRHMLPAYGNEVILMIKSTALASTITLMDVTGIAAKLVSESYRPIEVFTMAGAIYLLLTFIASHGFSLFEHAVTPDRRQPAPHRPAEPPETLQHG